jgi:hypothetical protein
MCRVLNVVFTLAINGHNGKVKQSGISLLPAHPPFPKTTLLKRFYKNPLLACTVRTAHCVEQGMTCIRPNG